MNDSADAFTDARKTGHGWGQIRILRGLIVKNNGLLL